MSDHVVDLIVALVICLFICNGNITHEILRRTKCQNREEKKRSGIKGSLCFERKNMKYFHNFVCVQLRKIDNDKRENSCSQFGEFLNFLECKASNEFPSKRR
jgi:hypothetical protein